MSNFYMNYINRGISVVPARARFDEKVGMMLGKIPAVKGWQDYVYKLPTENETNEWFKIDGITGIKIVTGEASNIGCIDIDSYDPDLVKKIIEIIPYSPCRIMGSPAKTGGKFLYRLYDKKSEWVAPGNLKQKVENDKKETVADIFYGNSCIVIPPSIYSIDANGNNTYYRWYDKSLDDIGVENLPILPLDVRYKISQLVGGSTKRDIAIDMSNRAMQSDESDVIGNNRFGRMSNYASALIRKRTSVETAIVSLVEYDYKTNSGNLFFLDRSKGHKTSSIELNAIKYYSDMLTFINSGKDHSLEIPNFDSAKEIVSDIHWMNLLPLETQAMRIDADIDDELIPSKWQNFIKDVAISNGVSKEVCLYTLLTQLSSLIGNKRTIKVKKKNKSWEEAHNIWAIYVSPSGTRKSQVVKTLSFPLEKIQDRIDNEFKGILHDFDGADAVQKIMIKELKKQREEEVIASVHDGLSVTVKRRIEELSNKIKEIEENNKLPTKPQAIVKGATTEKLIEIVGQNKTGTYLEFNELSQLTALFKKKGYETLRTFLMDSWDGLRPYSYQTKSSGEVFIKKNCTSMFACVQNSIFENELSEISMGINDDGFYQRSFIVINNSPVAIALDESFNPSRYDNMLEAFSKAYELSEEESHIVATDDAYSLYMQYEQRIMELAKDASSSALSSFWSKFTGKTVKLASLIEFVECKGYCHETISYTSMEIAIKLMERQISHIESVYPDHVDLQCREILRSFRFKMIKNGINHEKLLSKFKLLNNYKNYDLVMNRLYSINAIQFTETSKGIRYYFNPQIMEGSY